ncbi:MAG: hypothetical protein IPK58_26005 [Acidobacteria bacterium]|nr:hypothetical protein [Acidobacteriota bacterium]
MSRICANGLLGMVVVFGGLGWAFSQSGPTWSGNPQLAGIAAAVSLVFVLLILIFSRAATGTQRQCRGVADEFAV